jgi:hypothetical protein
MRAIRLIFNSSALTAALLFGTPATVHASDHINQTAKSMLEGILTSTPLVAERSDGRRRIEAASSGGAVAYRGSRLALAPGLHIFEDGYIRCIVTRALVYATTTSEPSTAVAETATAMCGSEREGLVTGYRLALWGAMDASAGRANDPAFIRAAKARVELIDRSIIRVVTTRIVHLRAMDTLSGRGGQSQIKPSNADRMISPATEFILLERRIEAIVEQL